MLTKEQNNWISILPAFILVGILVAIVPITPVGENRGSTINDRRLVASYPCTFLVMVKGTDGLVGFKRDEDLPFRPKVGDGIDFFTVCSVKYMTSQKRFLVSFNRLDSLGGSAEETIKILDPVNATKWKDAMKSPK